MLQAMLLSCPVLSGHVRILSVLSELWHGPEARCPCMADCPQALAAGACTPAPQLSSSGGANSQIEMRRSPIDCEAPDLEPRSG